MLEDLVETDTAGDPMDKDKKWCRKSTYTLQELLASKDINICANSVGKMLKEAGFSLRCNRKSIAETKHPDRDLQFQIIAEQRKRFEDLQQPIISVDTKKRELVGNFNNAGKRYRRVADETLVHDFPSSADGVAIPYGIYDLLNNVGMVVVGTSYDTPAFAVDAIDIWLSTSALESYGKVSKLLILADTGGSNGVRPRLWKYSLFQKINKVHGITVTVCHYPSGASKWNPIEHRLFSQISRNWQGVPLRNYDLILGCLAATTTTTGLSVNATLNKKIYTKGIKVSDAEMKKIKITRNKTLPNWNYTIG